MPRLLLVSLCTSSFALIIAYPEQIGEAFEAFIDWIKENQALGPFLMSITFILWTPLCAPATLMTISTGFILHNVFEEVWITILVGTVTVFIGTWLGSVLSFLIGRYVMRDCTMRLSLKYKLIKSLELALKTEGLRFCFLLRLCPIVPFNLINYILGGTSLTLRDYFLAGPGYVPICVAYVFVGTTIGSITDLVSGNYDGGPTRLVILIVGCAIALLLAVYITIVIRRYLRKTAEMIELGKFVPASTSASSTLTSTPSK